LEKSYGQNIPSLFPLNMPEYPCGRGYTTWLLRDILWEGGGGRDNDVYGKNMFVQGIIKEEVSQYR